MKELLIKRMKILAFGDTHTDTLSLEVARQKAHYADLVVCLGDFTLYGEELHEQLELINKFPKKVILIHGNHEHEPELREIIQHYPNIIFLHKEIHTHNGFTFIGYGGDGFSKHNQDFETFVEETIQENHNTILLLHGPPYGTKLDTPFEEFHCGNVSYRKSIEKHQPLLALSGHVHECEKQQDTLNQTTIFNPGKDGEIIDLQSLLQTRKI